MHADVAQSVERILGKDEVTSSNLVISSTDQSEMAGLFRVSRLFLQDSNGWPANLEPHPCFRQKIRQF